MKLVKAISVLALAGLSHLALASDDYIDLGYAGHTSKFYNKTYHVKFSKEVLENVLGTIEYNTSYADWRDPGEHEEFTTHTVLVDVYKLFPVNDNVQTFVGLGYNNSISKFNCISGCSNSSYTNQKPNGSAIEGTLGLRYLSENGLKISGQVSTINDLTGTLWNLTSSYEIDASYPILENVDLGLRQRNYKGNGSDLDFTSFYLRYSY
jgi:hypothetical protein